MNLLNNLTTGAHSKRVGYFSTIGADTKSKHAGGLEVKYQNGLKAATKEAFHLGEPTTSNEKTNLGKAMIALAIDADVDIKLNTNETTDKDIIRTIGNYVKEKLATAKKDKQILPQETRTLVKNMCLILNVAKEANNNSEVFGASRTKGVGVYDNKSGAWKGVSDKVVSGNAWESYFQDVLACDTQDVQKEARSGIDRVKHNTPGLEGRGDTRDENVAQMYGNVNGNSVEAQATASPTMSGPISRLFGWAGQSVTKGEEADLKKSMENLFLKATTYLDPDPNQMVGSGHPTINGVPVMPDTSGNNAASTSGKRAPAALNNAAGTSVKGPPTGEFNKLSKVDSLNSEMTLEQIRDQGRRGASATSTSGNNAAGDAVGTAAGSKANAAGTAAENNVASQEGPATSVNNAAGTVASTSVNNTTSTAETTGPSRESVLQENIEALNDGEIPDFVRELEPEDIAIVKNMDVSNPSENLTMVKNQITRNEIENEFDGVATARYYGFQEEQTHNSQLFEGILKRYEAAGGSTGDLLGRFGKDEDSFSNLLYRVTNETALTFSNLIIDEFISDESIKNLVTGKSTKDQKTQNLKAAMQFIMNNELFKGKLFTDDGTQLNEQSKTKQLLDLARVKDNELVGAFKKFARNINSVVKEQMGWRTTTFEGIS
ncbi:MAG: hypothetical protein VW397_08530, partial [Candidatus Margulisiibacteriota bacterium]